MYDGSGLIEVLRGHEYLSHPFAVTMYGGEVYWTDWRTNTLAKANKWTGHNVTVVQRTNTQPFDLQVYHPSRQPQGEFNTRRVCTNTRIVREQPHIYPCELACLTDLGSPQRGTVTCSQFITDCVDSQLSTPKDSWPLRAARQVVSSHQQQFGGLLLPRWSKSHLTVWRFPPAGCDIRPSSWDSHVTCWSQGLTKWPIDCFAVFFHIEVTTQFSVVNNCVDPKGSREAVGPVIGGRKREISKSCWLTAAAKAHDSDEATSCVDGSGRRSHFPWGSIDWEIHQNNSCTWYFGNAMKLLASVM